MESDRFMVAVGYHGHSFHGSQIQPDVRTVEGSISNALRRLTWWADGCLEMSSRTDAGVSVRFNLARIDLPRALSKNASETSIVRALNDHLPVGAVVISASRVNEDCKVRYASYRKYLYRLECIEEWPTNSDSAPLEEACRMIEGQHDFSNLSRMEEGRDPIRIVDECSLWLSSDGRPVGLVIRAKSFLWNQVRRIASSISGISSGRIKLADLESALESPDIPVDLGRAPSEGLVLWEISHPDFPKPLPSGLPNPDSLSARPEDPREYRRWLSMSEYEISALLEREWLNRLN